MYGQSLSAEEGVESCAWEPNRSISARSSTEMRYTLLTVLLGGCACRSLFYFRSEVNMQIQRQLPIFNPRLSSSKQAAVRNLSLVLLPFLATLAVSCNSQNSAPATPPNAQGSSAAVEESADGYGLFGSFELAANETVFTAAVGLQRQTNVGPELALGTKAMGRLDQSHQQSGAEWGRSKESGAAILQRSVCGFR